ARVVGDVGDGGGGNGLGGEEGGSDGQDLLMPVRGLSAHVLYLCSGRAHARPSAAQMAPARSLSIVSHVIKQALATSGIGPAGSTTDSTFGEAGLGERVRPGA